MAVVHQSDISSWMRCPTAYMYQQAGKPRRQTSALAYGSVIHHALETFERMRHTPGTSYTDATEGAVATFDFYWHPHNIEAICQPVDTWLPRQSYSELRIKGIDAIRTYADRMRFDDHELLATEYSFQVPIAGTWDDTTNEPHVLAGTIDRLAVRHQRQHPYLAIDDFKGLDVTTPLPTPTGWTTMGEIAVGDQVFGADGNPCTVTAVSEIHHRPCYKISFDDGTHIIADNVHQWQVHSGPQGNTIDVRDTEYLRANLLGRRGQRDKRVPNAEALNLPDADLPIDPYVLGAWLGDGQRNDASIRTVDPGIFQNIAAAGYAVGLPRRNTTESKAELRGIHGLRGLLRNNNLLGNKHVPTAYLRASRQQRLSLLQGLMDADGTWNKARHQAVFVNADQNIARAVQELAVSLGAKAPMWSYQVRGFVEPVTVFNVSFSPVAFNPFRIERKANLVREGRARAKRRLIMSIEPVDTVPTRCIEVDSIDHLYLCGDQMVPTHNSGKEYTYLRQNLQFSAYSYASTCREFWVGWRGEDGFGPERGQQLFERFANIARRGTWINLRTVKFQDAGWRGPHDYTRFALAVQQMMASVQADIYPLSLSGETCQFCDYRDICAGVGVPDNDHGSPF